MRPINKTHQMPDSSPFADSIIKKVKKYETRRKNKQRILEATAILLLSYLLLIDLRYLVNKQNYNNHMNFSGITEVLMQLNHQRKSNQIFGFNVGKIIKVNQINYTHS